MDQSQVIKGFLHEELKIFDSYLHNSVKSDNPHLTDIISYVFDTNGKQLRPTLVLLTAKACGKIIPETYHGATTVELLHTATLVHDDVIDKSNLRRGKSSVNAIYDNTKAVLVGDYLLSTALAESVKTGNLEIIKIISELGQNLAEGELYQYILANEIIIDEAAYFDVINKKTASLMQASLMIGAITGGANSEMILHFKKIGSILGICFQIRDDIFDYYTKDVGKPTGSDIREGKITLPLIYALKNAPKSISNDMMKIIKSGQFNDDNIQILLSFAKEYRGISEAFDKIDSLLFEADEIINSFNFNEEMKSYMKLFLSYLKDRSY